MSETGITNFEALENLLHVKGDVEVAMAIHDLTHALGADILTTMLEHINDGKPADRTEKKTIHSDATTLEDKLASAAKELNAIADSIVRNDAELPEDISEIQVEVTLKVR